MNRSSAAASGVSAALIECGDAPPEEIMTAILSMFAVLATALLYYRAADRRGLPGMAWAMAGIILYYGGFLFWLHVVLRPLMGGQFQTHSFWTGIAMDLTSILAGASCAAVFGFKVLAGKARKPSDDAP
jgi:uncharacterized RDD family membrane protein YckC